jgi:hypothetical protein
MLADLRWTTAARLRVVGKAAQNSVLCVLVIFATANGGCACLARGHRPPWRRVTPVFVAVDLGRLRRAVFGVGQCFCVHGCAPVGSVWGLFFCVCSCIAALRAVLLGYLLPAVFAAGCAWLDLTPAAPAAQRPVGYPVGAGAAAGKCGPICAGRLLFSAANRGNWGKNTSCTNHVGEWLPVQVAGCSRASVSG